jgi:hypothetical protein
MNKIVEGGCLCGETRYRLTAVPSGLGDCHCVDCRRASGAPFVTWGTVPRRNVELLQGKLREVRFADRVRSFAACCGTPLFFAETTDSPTVDFTVGSLDDPTPFAPRKAIWTEDRLPWVILDPALPSYRQSSGAS